jgi:hypothetical protein
MVAGKSSNEIDWAQRTKASNDIDQTVIDDGDLRSV